MLPQRAVVAAPLRGDGLRPAEGGAGQDERARVRRLRQQPGIGGARHLQAVGVARRGVRQFPAGVHGIRHRAADVGCGRFVHIVPQPGQAGLVHPAPHLAGPPLAGGRVVKIRQSAQPRPDVAVVFAAVAVAHKVAALLPFVVHLVVRIDLDARIDDGDAAQALRF